MPKIILSKLPADQIHKLFFKKPISKHRRRKPKDPAVVTADYVRMLREKKKMWMMRESRFEGMMTVDYLKPDNSSDTCHFACSVTGEWHMYTTQQVIQKNISQTLMHISASDAFMQRFKLFSSLENNGFDIDADDVLLPPSDVATNNEMFAEYEQTESLLNVFERPNVNGREYKMAEKRVQDNEKLLELECPIMLDPLSESPSKLVGITPSGQMYHANQIQILAASGGVDPFTREPLEVETIRNTGVLSQLYLKNELLRNKVKAYKPRADVGIRQRFFERKGAGTALDEHKGAAFSESAYGVTEDLFEVPLDDPINGGAGKNLDQAFDPLRVCKTTCTIL